jgi:hypothetical protein
MHYQFYNSIVTVGFQTDSGAHPASYSVGAGVLSLG